MFRRRKTLKSFLARLPAERRETVEAIRELILANIDPSFEQGLQYGMPAYHFPHAVGPRQNLWVENGIIPGALRRDPGIF